MKTLAALAALALASCSTAAGRVDPNVEILLDLATGDDAMRANAACAALGDCGPGIAPAIRRRLAGAPDRIARRLSALLETHVRLDPVKTSDRLDSAALARIADVPFVFPPPDPARCRLLIARLDDNDIDVRTAAMKELAGLSWRVEAELRQALVETRSPEVASRVRVLLEHMQHLPARLGGAEPEEPAIFFPDSSESDAPEGPDEGDFHQMRGAPDPDLPKE